MPKLSQINSIALDQKLAKTAVRLLVKTPITPNVVTGASIPIGCCAGWFVSQGDFLAHIGAALFVFVVWLDHVDGELARETGRTSEFGHYFDHIAAMCNYAAMFFGAGIGIPSDKFGGWGLTLGIVASISVVLIMTVRMYMERRGGRLHVKQTVRSGFEIEDILYAVGPITWLGILDFFILLAGVGAPLFLIFVTRDCWLKLNGITGKNE